MEHASCPDAHARQSLMVGILANLSGKLPCCIKQVPLQMGNETRLREAQNGPQLPVDSYAPLCLLKSI